MPLTVFEKEYTNLLGEDEPKTERVSDGSIIKRFDLTPHPREPEDIVCPHFLELKWATGCNYECAWCYLQGTCRMLPYRTRLHEKDRTKIRRHVGALLNHDGSASGSANGTELLNSGELADSLAAEKCAEPFSRFIIPLFESQEHFKLLMLSKSDYVDNLLTIEGQESTIVSFSVNPPYVSERWEKGAPPPERRLVAAARLAAAGYEVRLRIDPIVPVPKWKQRYDGLLQRIFRLFRPERITLGSLRGLQSTINNCRDKSWTEFLSEKSPWGKRVESSLRQDAFGYVIERLKDEWGYSDVAMCKEPVATWNALGLDYRKIRCNCIA